MTELQKKTLFILGTLVIIPAVFVGPFCLNRFVLRHRFCGVLQMLVAAVRPPTDLWRCLGRQRIDITRSGAVSELIYSNRYTGNHTIGLCFQRTRNGFLESHRVIPLKMHLTFLVDGKEVFSRSCERKYSPFYGKECEGFDLVWYRCPEDLPLDKPVMLRVMILEPDTEMGSHCGNATVEAWKSSDK